MAAVEVRRRLQEFAEWEKDLKRRRDDLDAALAENGRRVEEWEQGFRQRQAAIEAQRQEVHRQLHEGLDKREAQLKELALQLDARQSDLKQQEESLAEKEAVQRAAIEAQRQEVHRQLHEALDKRESQLKELASQLDARQSDLKQQEESLAEKEAAQRQRNEAEAAAAAEKMRQALESLDQRRNELERERARPVLNCWSGSGGLPRRRLRGRAAATARRSPGDVGRMQADVERLRQQLLDDRTAAAEQALRNGSGWRPTIGGRVRNWMSSGSRWWRRGEHADQCRAALEQLRGELEQMHRETLEIRRPPRSFGSSFPVRRRPPR